MISTTRTTTTTVDRIEATPRVASPVTTVCPITTAREQAEWAEYVDEHAGGTLFHHPNWCSAVQETFGHRPLHLLARCGDEVAGVLPMMEVNSLLGGRMIVSVPYGNGGGILADDINARNLLARQAMRLAEERSANVLDLRSAEAGVPGLESVQGYVGFVRDLPERVEDVPTFFPRKARAAGRQARDRDGVVVRHDARLTRVVWELYCRSMRRLGSVNYPYRFFKALQRRLGAQAWVTVAFVGDRPVSGVLSYVHGDTVSPYVAGADERVRTNGATNYLYWRIVERAVEAGLRRFDFGRSRADNLGAAGFKKNQGFEPVPLGYQRYVPPGRKAPNLKPSNPRFSLARRVWPRLPLAATRTLGAFLSRSIPG